MQAKKNGSCYSDLVTVINDSFHLKGEIIILRLIVGVLSLLARLHLISLCACLTAENHPLHYLT